MRVGTVPQWIVSPGYDGASGRPELPGAGCTGYRVPGGRPPAGRASAVRGPPYRVPGLSEVLRSDAYNYPCPGPTDRRVARARRPRRTHAPVPELEARRRARVVLQRDYVLVLTLADKAVPFRV